MPRTINGFGTAVCRSRGSVQWAKRPQGWWARAVADSNFAAFDALECIVILFLPVIPLKAVHTYHWQANTYHQVPIRWSWDLVLRTFLLHWFWLPVLVLSITVGSFSWSSPWAGLATSIGFSVGSIWLLRRQGRRHQAIRWALGPHVAGASDPATWTAEMLAPWPGVFDQFKTTTYASASRQGLLERRYNDAMWAARLCVAREDRQEGEKLTDQLMADAGFQAAVQAVKAAPETWEERLGVAGAKP